MSKDVYVLLSRNFECHTIDDRKQWLTDFRFLPMKINSAALRITEEKGARRQVIQWSLPERW